MKHRCNAPNCTTMVSQSLLMCPRHWAQVPHRIQIRVVRSWHALTRGTNPENHTTWFNARQEAIDSVTPKVPQGRPIIAQRFNAGSAHPITPSPAGTAEPLRP